jgi:hypothetical protein
MQYIKKFTQFFLQIDDMFSFATSYFMTVLFDFDKRPQQKPNIVSYSAWSEYFIKKRLKCL